MSSHLCPYDLTELTTVEWGKAANILHFINQTFEQNVLLNYEHTKSALELIS